ncbi:MAG TPA: type IV pilus biogenesis/stability protein PilW [Chromatiaceae bacterium]|nr:type IV pilus biogenesis/stability protein PilW [Chromatiaceae bacterium]
MIMRHLASLLFLPLILGGCVTDPSKGEDAPSIGKLGKDQNYESPSNTYIQLAYEYMKRGDYATALNKAKKAVQRDPNNGNAHLVLALLYEALGENGSANAAYRRALEVDGKNPYALNAYGSYLCKLGEYERALSHFDKALQNPLYQTPWVALANAGYCARKAGNLSRAEAYLRKALERNPGYPMALFQMAEVRFAQEKFMSARAYLQRYREVAKPTAPMLYLSILTERQLGNADQVRSDELLLKSDFPDSEQAQKLGY